MPAQNGTVRVICAIDADGNIRALPCDENDALIVNHDVRSQLAIPDATQVYKGGVVTGTSSDLYTVPTGYTLYLTQIAITGHNGNAAVQSGYIYVYNGDDEFQIGFKLSVGAGQGGQFQTRFDPPIPCLEDWYIRANSPDADFSVVAFFNGLLVG